MGNINIITNEEIDKICQRYLSGENIAEICIEYRHDFKTIVKILERYCNYHKRNRLSFTNEEKLDIINNFLNHNDDYIMNTYSFGSMGSVYSYMRRNGISREKEDKWSREEIKLLQEIYQYGCDVSSICDLFPNRTYQSIVTKAIRLNLKTRNFWTDKEISLLKDVYQTHYMDDIIQLFPKHTRGAIIAKAKDLSLKNIVKFQDYEIKYICDNWKNMTDEEIGKKLNRNKGGIANKRLSLGFSRYEDKSSYTSLSEYIRGHISEWKNESMKSCQYKCIITGERFDDIHHIHGLNLIMSETIELLDFEVKKNINEYSQEELDLFVTKFNEVQSKYPLGICLTKEIHKNFHSVYGYGYNTEEQWNDFINNNLKIA